MARLSLLSVLVLATAVLCTPQSFRRPPGRRQSGRTTLDDLQISPVKTPDKVDTRHHSSGTQGFLDNVQKFTQGGGFNRPGSSGFNRPGSSGSSRPGNRHPGSSGFGGGSRPSGGFHSQGGGGSSLHFGQGGSSSHGSSFGSGGSSNQGSRFPPGGSHHGSSFGSGGSSHQGSRFPPGSSHHGSSFGSGGSSNQGSRFPPGGSHHGSSFGSGGSSNQGSRFPPGGSHHGSSFGSGGSSHQGNRFPGSPHGGGFPGSHQGGGSSGFGGGFDPHGDRERVVGVSHASAGMSCAHFSVDPNTKEIECGDVNTNVNRLTGDQVHTTQIFFNDGLICPVVREECADLRFQKKPEEIKVITCTSDAPCTRGVTRCCRDTCLKKSVCKTAVKPVKRG